MPRQARTNSSTGYLHIIARGIGKQILFEEAEDYRFYLSILERFSAETEITVLAYCLMDNHVHLLVLDKEGKAPLLMKKTGVSYSGYFNRKYNRSGHLFQDRYKSEAIEDDAYLLSVFRYILNNPQKAGIGAASDYPWNSYSCYGKADTFVDTRILCDLIGDRRRYRAFLHKENDDVCLEYEKQKHDDEWAKSILRAYLNGESGTVLQSYDRVERNIALRNLKREGISIRQLERLTGINRGVVQKA